jgi:hypothetical protein
VDLSKEKCPTCGESLWLKTLITLTKDEKSIFSFCIGTQLLEEFCINLKMQGISDPMEYLRNLWHSEYERYGANRNWCSKTKIYRCLLCGTEIKYEGEKSTEAFQKHLKVCPARNKEGAEKTSQNEAT